jgi:MFS family permease
VVAFLGTLNPSAGDVSVFLPLEQSLLAHSVSDRDRTALFVRYGLAGYLLGAAGTLLAALPDLAERWWAIAPSQAMSAMFVLYAALGLASGAIYRAIDEPPASPDSPRVEPLGASRTTIYRLAALFSIDAFGGGLVVQSILALWLFASFGVSVAGAATLFFWMNVLSAVSQLAAAPLAARIGLVNTMVFTHLPSNLCLVAAAFASSLPLVIALLLARSLLSQLDVPARNSYVMSVVTPAERAAAASLTSVPRSLASGVGPLISGWLLLSSGFGWPLLLGGVLKAVYDIALLAAFRDVRPPQERAARGASAPSR